MYTTEKTVGAFFFHVILSQVVGEVGIEVRIVLEGGTAALQKTYW